MNLLHKAIILFAAACCFTGCENFPVRLTGHEPQGKTSILISLREQRATLMQGKERVVETSISTGREGHAISLCSVCSTRQFVIVASDLDP